MRTSRAPGSANLFGRLPDRASQHLLEPIHLDGPQRRDCVADDAVSCEPVSTANSLLTGKLTGNFGRIRPSIAIFVSVQRTDSIVYARIPYATEQGISKDVLGKIFRATGNFAATDVSVRCSHAFFASAERGLFSLAFLQSEEEQMADGCRSREPYGETRRGVKAI